MTTGIYFIAIITRVYLLAMTHYQNIFLSLRATEGGVAISIRINYGISLLAMTKCKAHLIIVITSSKRFLCVGDLFFAG